MDVTLTIPDEILERIANRVVELLDGQAADRWLTVAEAADHLRCPKSRIYDLCSARRIPFYKDGRRTLLRLSESR